MNFVPSDGTGRTIPGSSEASTGTTVIPHTTLGGRRETSGDFAIDFGSNRTAGAGLRSGFEGVRNSLLNGDATQGKIASGGVVKKLLGEHKDATKVIEELYLRCLARVPTEKEMAKLKSHFGGKQSDEQVLTDIFWALLNSKEFLFRR